MLYTRIGSCNHCGKCCLSKELGGEMLENPCIERGEDRCKFYMENLNNKMYGHCLIYGRGGKPTSKVKDRFGETITDKQIRWFNQNCIDYPRGKDMVAGHILPECSFTVEVVTNG